MQKLERYEYQVIKVQRDGKILVHLTRASDMSFKTLEEARRSIQKAVITQRNYKKRVINGIGIEIKETENLKDYDIVLFQIKRRLVSDWEVLKIEDWETSL